MLNAWIARGQMEFVSLGVNVKNRLQLSNAAWELYYLERFRRG